MVSTIQEVTLVKPTSGGQARNSTREFRQFLGIAKGSLAELETLIILSQSLGFLTKENLEMPSGYDDFTERAAIGYAGGTEQQRANRAILRKAMEADGFKVYQAEWWHYDFQICPENRILAKPFSDIK